MPLPPLTTNGWPVTYDASSLARNATIAATSAAVPIRLDFAMGSDPYTKPHRHPNQPQPTLVS